jgi:hypothetical protein
MGTAPQSNVTLTEAAMQSTCSWSCTNIHSGSIKCMTITASRFNERMLKYGRHSVVTRNITPSHVSERGKLCCNEHTRSIQKFPDWPPGARASNGTALCHYVQLYRCFASQSSEFCRHNTLCCFSTSVYCCKRIFRYRFSPETFGYSHVCPRGHVTYTKYSSTSVRTKFWTENLKGETTRMT